MFSSKVYVEGMSVEICILQLRCFSAVMTCTMLEKNACVILISILSPCHADVCLQMFHYLHLMRSLSDVLFFPSFFFLLLRDFPSVVEIILYLLYLAHQFCGTIMAELDALLPLAAACRDGSLLEVRSSFVEACGRAAFAMLGRVQERALEVPSSAPLRNLHALLATVVYVHQRLEHYHSRLRDSNTAAAKV